MFTLKRYFCFTLILVCVYLVPDAVIYPQSEYNFIVVREYNPEQIDHIREILPKKDKKRIDWGKQFLKDFYGDAYSTEFSDLVIYIDKRGCVWKQLISRGEVENEFLLKGDNYLYIFVLLDILPTKSKKNLLNKSIHSSITEKRSEIIERSATQKKVLISMDKIFDKKKVSSNDSLYLHRSLKIRHREKIVESLAKIGKVEIPTKDEQLKDYDKAIKLIDLGKGGQDTSNLYLGYFKVPIAKNSWNRISISTRSGYSLGDKQTNRLRINLGNTRSNLFGAGFALGSALNANNAYPEDTADSNTIDTYLRPNLYLYMILYFERSAPPLDCSCPHTKCLGFVIGTSVYPAEFLNDYIIALVWNMQHLNIPASIMAGTTIFGYEKKDSNNIKKTKWSSAFFLGFGIEF